MIRRLLGNLITVGDVPPPPPPKVLLREALDRAIDACIADMKRTLLKCFKLLQTELDKVTP